MSMNIYISASRQIQVVKTGKIETQHTVFKAWQTPTRDTYEILAAEDRLAAYKAWVLACSRDEVKGVYADDDIFCEGAIIGLKKVNVGKEHVAELDGWVAAMEEEGYEVEVSVM